MQCDIGSMTEMNTNNINHRMQILITLQARTWLRNKSVRIFCSVTSSYNWRFYFSKYLNEFKARQKQLYLTTHYGRYNQKLSQKTNNWYGVIEKLVTIMLSFPVKLKKTHSQSIFGSFCPRNLNTRILTRFYPIFSLYAIVISSKKIRKIQSINLL